MKNRLALLSVVLAVVCSAAFAQSPALPTPPAGRGKSSRPPVNPKLDALYKLGPDSQPMEGVPQGKFSEPRIIPSQVFPGTQHTYVV